MRFLVGLVLVLAAVSQAQAQDPSTGKRLEELERSIREHQRELDELRAARSTEQPTPPPPQSGPASPESASPESVEPPQFRFDYDDGFLTLKGRIADSDYEIRFHGFIQLDYRAYVHSQANAAFPAKGEAEDGFLVRRAVVGFIGKFSDFAYKFEIEPVRGARGLLPLFNFWVEWRHWEELKIRAGHFLPPITLADPFTYNDDFVELPMVVQAVSYGQRPGAMVNGSFADGLLQYFLALQNELDTNGTVSGDPITTARLATAVGPIQLGASGSWERFAGTQQQSVPGMTPAFFTFFQPVSVGGWTQRYGLDLAFAWGPFFASSEYCFMLQERKGVQANGTDGTPLVVEGAYVDLGWMFVGPPRESKSPHLPFYGWEFFSLDSRPRVRQGRNVGAEVVLRFEWLSLSPRKGDGIPELPSTAPNADLTKKNDAKAVGIGFNIYVIENFKIMLDYFHVHVGDQSRAERGHSREGDELMFRAQLGF